MLVITLAEHDACHGSVLGSGRERLSSLLELISSFSALFARFEDQGQNEKFTCPTRKSHSLEQEERCIPAWQGEG